jgi:hypothetical protein
MMKTIFLRLGRLLSRLHRWVPAALAFSLVRPLSEQNDDAKGRFAYACMMERKNARVQSIVAGVLRGELDRSPDVNLWLAKICWSLGRLRLAALIYRRTERQSGASAQARVATTMRLLAETIRNNDIYKCISAAVDGLGLPEHLEEPIVFAPVSSRYFDLFRLWVEQIHERVRGPRVILALDGASKDRLEQEFDCKVIDLSTYFVFHDGGVIDKLCRNNLWILRVMVLRELIARGYSVLSLDLDAIVVGDLEGLIASLPASDIVAQMDYSIPVDVARELGFVLCCGFMLIRSNAATKAFFDSYCQWTIEELDDQLGINHLLQDAGVKNVVRNSLCMQFDSAGVSWVCPDKSLVSRDHSYGTVIRHFQRAGETIEQLREGLGLMPVSR